MTVQDTPTLGAIGDLDLRATDVAKPAQTAAKPVRRLPVQKDWPTWALVATQFGILVGIDRRCGKSPRAPAGSTPSSGRSRARSPTR